jgi:hypothetical protein
MECENSLPLFSSKQLFNCPESENKDLQLMVFINRGLDRYPKARLGF